MEKFGRFFETGRFHRRVLQNFNASGVKRPGKAIHEPGIEALAEKEKDPRKAIPLGVNAHSVQSSRFHADQVGNEGLFGCQHAVF